MAGIANKIVAGAQFVNSGTGKAIIGGAIAAAGAAVVGQAFLRTPAAVKNSKYTGDLMFPSDLINTSSNRNFYMTIQFTEYQRRSIFNQPFLAATGGIRLPIPNNLIDTQSVNYDSSAKADATTGAAIEAGLKGRNGTSSGGLSFGSIGSAIAGGIGGKAVQTASAAATTAGIDVAQGLQLGGLAQNPFMTVLFNSPTFKKHTFSWKLAPNNIDESNTLRDIIQTFRSNMLPAMAPNAGGTLLTYPNMAIINLSPDDSFLYKFKPCVVESMSVNFAAGGQPSFFKNSNAPTEVQIDINFLEIEYWLKEDVEGTSLRTQGAFF